MIKIDKDSDDVPPSLDSLTTQQRRNELIQEGAYLRDKKYQRRYKQRDVKQKLEKIYRDKCGFCEQCIERFDVEHFRPKSIYYWLAYSWDNLLAVCPTCNGNKDNDFKVLRDRVGSAEETDLSRIHHLAKEYDEQEGNQLIHPEREAADTLLIFEKNGSIASDDDRAIYTIDLCGLNRNRLKDRRKKLWDDLAKKIRARFAEYQLKKEEERDPKVLKEAIGQVIKDFASDTDDLKNEFIAFRRYVIRHFSPKGPLQS